MESLQGQFLVATPDLADPNFFHTVILLVRHDEDGALGLVLNRPTNAGLRDLWEKLTGKPCEHEATLRLGGPCEGPLMALHDQADLGDAFGDLEELPCYFTAQGPQLEALVQRSAAEALFFVGYSGWSGGQLERELREGSWLHLAAHGRWLQLPPDELWERLSRHARSCTLASALKLRGLPDDPRVN